MNYDTNDDPAEHDCAAIEEELANARADLARVTAERDEARESIARLDAYHIERFAAETRRGDQFFRESVRADEALKKMEAAIQRKDEALRYVEFALENHPAGVRREVKRLNAYWRSLITDINAVRAKARATLSSPVSPPEGEAETDETKPVGQCPKCGAPWFVVDVGYCGGCTP